MIDCAVKAPCCCATTSDIVLSGLQTIDGLSVVSGGRVLVRAQSDAMDNGIYIASASAWSRSADLDDTAEIAAGTLVWVYGGDSMSGWHDITTYNPAIGSTTIDFRRSVMGSIIISVEGFSYGLSSVAIHGSASGSAEFLSSGSGVVVVESIFGAAISSVGLSGAQFDTYSTASVNAVSDGSATASAYRSQSNAIWILGDAVGDSFAVEAYDLASEVVSVKTSLSPSAQLPGWCAAGNGSFAILHGSNSNIATSIKYTYANEFTQTSSVMGDSFSFRCATQSATIGFFYGGDDAGVDQVTVDKVTFATEARTAGTNLGAGRSAAAAQGNNLRGIISGGYRLEVASATTTKYTYASNSVSAATSLAIIRYSHGSAGNETRAIFAAGFSSVGGDLASTEKYTFSGDSVSSGTTLIGETNAMSGGGGNGYGIFHGCPTLTEKNTNKYTFAGDVISAGSTLNYSHTKAAIICDSPGGLT